MVGLDYIRFDSIFLFLTLDHVVNPKGIVRNMW